MAGRMGVVIADNRWSAVPCIAVGPEQRHGIDLESRRWLQGYVLCGNHGFDCIAFTEKQSAAFHRGSFVRFRKKSCHHTPCHRDLHPQILLVIGGNESIIEGFTSGGEQRLDKALAEASGLSRERVKALLQEERITLAGKIARQASLKVADGTAFSITVPAAIPAEAVAQEIPLAVVYEDSDLIVVDKPAGLVVHPAAGNLDGTLVNALLHHCRGQLSGIGGVARPGIVHRIDKDTSGLLVVAKTDVAHEGLARQFADHSIMRAYRAVAAGHVTPPSGRIEGAIARSNVNRKKMAIVEDGRGKHAVTHYKTLEALRFATLVECRLETGRTHQVRVHMASIGHALLGDPVYGRTPSKLRPTLNELGFSRQALHAAELGFVHPVNGQTLQFSSPLPDDMRALIDELRN